MWRLIAIWVSVCSLNGALAKPVFQIRGEISPRRPGTVTLHAVANPFATSTIAAEDGDFRFRNIEAGTYTLSVSAQHAGDTRMTIEVGPGTADKKGRVLIKVELNGEALNREQGATVSAREWRIPDRARREYEEAGRMVAKRDFDGAKACLRRAVEIAPRFAEAWNHLGTMAYQSQHYQEAEGYFRQGVMAAPDAYEPLVNLGGVLINLGKPDEALKYNAEAALRRPHDALAQSQLGMSYMMLNQFDAAEQHLLLACRLDPSHFSNPQIYLAELFVRRKDFHRAADQLEDFLRHHPDWPDAPKVRETITLWRH